MLIRRKGRCGVFAGNPVWSTSEHLVVEVLTIGAIQVRFLSFPCLCWSWQATRLTKWEQPLLSVLCWVDICLSVCVCVRACACVRLAETETGANRQGTRRRREEKGELFGWTSARGKSVVVSTFTRCSLRCRSNNARCLVHDHPS